jgi:imidazolonepropionase-like amidohydrolase
MSGAAARYYLHATLLPEGDRAVDLWVAEGRLTFTPQEGAEELAPAGGYVLAGLVDCHAHLTLDAGNTGLPLGSAELVEANRRGYLDAGVLLLRDIGAVSNATLRLPPDDWLPRVQPAGRFLAPPGGYFGIQQETAAADLVQAAARQVAGGARWVKIIADWPRAGSGSPADFSRGEVNYPVEAVRQAVEAVHRAGGRVAVHAIARGGIVLGVEAGVDSIEHASALDNDLLEGMAAKGIAWTPTAAIGLGWLRNAEAMGETEAAAWLGAWAERFHMLLPRARALGVPVLAGTDLLPPGGVAYEVAALHELGLSPVHALAAASTAARAYLGYPALDDGAPADLVLYPADPRDSPELLLRPSLVMLDGHIVCREG